MMICLPNGTVVHHINANYFLDITSMKPEDMENNNVFSFSSSFEDPSTATYMQFLREGLRRGLPSSSPSPRGPGPGKKPADRIHAPWSHGARSLFQTGSGPYLIPRLPREVQGHLRLSLS
uniref:Sepn1 protein n=1 Tax=Mus musculus TaxID=10090 RepID=Q80UX9_MOUSE|nr:Sepn1 protein [Mus musculus]